MLVSLLLLAGCSTIPYEPVEETPPPPIAQPPAPPIAQSEIVPAPASAPAPAPAPAPRPPKVRPEPFTFAILLSDDIPAYEGVAAALEELAGARLAASYSLDGKDLYGPGVMAEINRSAPDRLVAIGVEAARAAAEHSAVPVVFCQVFNHGEIGLPPNAGAGVALIPPFSLHIGAWQKVSPDLERVGVITGPGHEDLIADARTRARAAGIDLISRVVESDKEALYVFKRMVPEIEGFWMLPDNRILSPRMIRELMDYGQKHGIQIVAFSPALLNWGALMSVTGVDEDVAQQVLRLVDATSSEAIAGVTELTDAEIEINRSLARQLGLVLPAQFAATRRQLAK